MRWRGRRQSSNIEDERGAASQRGGFRMPRRGGRVRVRGGGMSLGMLVLVGIASLVLGINPLELLNGGGLPGGLSGNSSGPAQVSRPASQDADRQAKAFVATVLAETEDAWHKEFRKRGATYQEPRLVLFSGAVRSACGFASAATGPFYCPGDSKVYLDMSFFRELRAKFGAPGDFAQAYVIAHEVGHHVQNLTGILPKFNRARRSMSQAEANRMSIRVELQADCYAGIWAAHAKHANILERGDLEEALNAAHQIGDDAIQKRVQGYVVPEAFNHGTSAQRAKWFRIGYQRQSMEACNTFSVRNP